MKPRGNRLAATTAAALVVVGSFAGCSAQARAQKAARVTIGGATRTTRAASCSQGELFRTIDIRDPGNVEAVVLLSGDKAIPQWVKIRNFEGFTGSFWAGGVGDAHADIVRGVFTIAGSAYGIDRRNPNKVTTTDFKITAEC